MGKVGSKLKAVLEGYGKFFAVVRSFVGVFEAPTNLAR